MIGRILNKLLLIQTFCLVIFLAQAQDTVRLYLDPSLNGDSVTLKLTAKNFLSVDHFIISFNYPTSDLVYSYSNLNPSFNVQSLISNSGFIEFDWSNPNALPISLPDNTELAEFKFYVIRKQVQTCFDFNVLSRPTSFFGVLSAIIPVETNSICKNLFGGLVSGLLRLDTNKDCLIDAIEPAISGSIIKFKSSTAEYLAISKEDGSFNRFLPYDNYIVSTLGSTLLQNCQSNTAISLSTNNTTTNFAAPFSAQNDCPLLDVEFNASSVSLCKSNFATIRYFNKGTVAATNSYIEIDLDSRLGLEQSSHPYIQTGLHSYKFDIGTVDIQTSSQIVLLLKASCDPNQLNSTVQNFARIYPNNYCSTSLNFSGADLEINSSCINNENVFEIKNVGSGSMKEEIIFNTVEDDIMPNYGGKIKLDKDASEIIKYPANGKTRIIIVDTISNHPYQIRASAGIEGCGTLSSGGISKGYINNFAQGDESPNISRYSTEIKTTNSNPIELLSIPEGAGAQHYIFNDDRIRYTIKVQNNTDHNIHRVVIRNKIPTTLDLATIQLNRTEINYDWSIQDDRTLEIVFDSIDLPSSLDNELFGQLYFSYSIKPNKESLFNTVIENYASVIFDSKQIISSPKIKHTIANFIFTIVKDNPSDLVKVESFPNPFLNEIRFKFDRADNYTIQFFNQNGEKLAEEKTNKLEFITNILSLEPIGIYYYKVYSNKKLISSAKIIKSK
ncbi:MAG: T9SS type A sorting domain-containing protein [Saprospiraceae bacterium]